MKMELWVEREAVETVVRAAVAFANLLSVATPEIDGAVCTIQDAVKEANEDPLDLDIDSL